MGGWVGGWVGGLASSMWVGGQMDEGWPLPEVPLCSRPPGSLRRPLTAVLQGLVTETHEPGMAPSWQQDG